MTRERDKIRGGGESRSDRARRELLTRVRDEQARRDFSLGGKRDDIRVKTDGHRVNLEPGLRHDRHTRTHTYTIIASNRPDAYSRTTSALFSPTAPCKTRNWMLQSQV